MVDRRTFGQRVLGAGAALGTGIGLQHRAEALAVVHERPGRCPHCRCKRLVVLLLLLLLNLLLRAE